MNVENTDYLRFAERIIRAAGKRVAEGDVEALPELIQLGDTLDRAIGDAVGGLRSTGFSWAEIAARTGTTRQAAHARWASKPL